MTRSPVLFSESGRPTWEPGASPGAWPERPADRGSAKVSAGTGPVLSGLLASTRCPWSEGPDSEPLTRAPGAAADRAHRQTPASGMGLWSQRRPSCAQGHAWEDGDRSVRIAFPGARWSGPCFWRDARSLFS